MPVSGNEEPRVQPISRNSSPSSAGIPIKKRRFPSVQMPSPKSEVSSAQNESLQKEQSTPSQESSLTDTSFSGLRDVKKNTSLEANGQISADQSVTLVNNNANLSNVKLEEQNLEIPSGFVDEMDSKEKLTLGKRSVGQVVSGNFEMQSASKEAVSPIVREDVKMKQISEGKCNSKLSTYSENTELSLGLKEPLVPDVVGMNISESNQIQKKLGSASLDLSLGKGIDPAQCKTGRAEVNVLGDHQCASRSNWDLNTTMDAWEASVNDALAGEGDVGNDGLDLTADSKYMIASIIMNGKVQADVASEYQKDEECERRSNVPQSSAPGQQSKMGDSLNLCLNSSSDFSLQQSNTSVMCNTGSVLPNLSLPGMAIPICLQIRASPRIVKPEPVDENPSLDSKGLDAKIIGSVDNRRVKSELIEKGHPEGFKSLSGSADSVLFKSETTLASNGETPKRVTGISSISDSQVLQGSSSCLSTLTMPTTHRAGSSECLAHSKEIARRRGVPSHSGNSTCSEKTNSDRRMLQKIHEEQGASETVSRKAFGCELNATDCLIDSQGDNELCRLKLMNIPPQDSRGNGEGFGSDEEKFNVSGDVLEEDPYGSDYESDGNHASGAVMDVDQNSRDDDEYEDGEVRELHTADENLGCKNREAEDVTNDESNNNRNDSLGVIHDNIISSHNEEKDSKTEDPGVTDINSSQELVKTVSNEKNGQGTEKDSSLKDLLAGDKSTAVEDIKRPVRILRRKPLDRTSREGASKGQQTEQSSDQPTNGMLLPINPVPEQGSKGSDVAEKKETVLPKAGLPKTEASSVGDDATKDGNNGGNRSRIISLSRPSNVSTSCKTESFPGRSLPSRAARERFADLAFEGDRFHPKGRDEAYIEGPHKISRERNQDQFFRNSRLNFTRGRGRGSGRFNTRHGDWDSDRNFASEFYNDSPDYRFTRHKHSSVSDPDMESDNYIVGSDDHVLGPRRGGRKSLNDEEPVFHHPSARRLSPEVREGTGTRGVQMVCRVQRYMSPNSCIAEDGSDLVGMRHDEKFMRAVPDGLDPMFGCPQPPYEGIDNRFVRNNRNYSSIQSRGPRIRSKSPLRSRTRSPGPWASPRRRSHESFNRQHPGLARRRSPAIFRMDRMRSPDRPCFPGEMASRRHGSPPYMSQTSHELRDMDSGHRRSLIGDRRSPSNRVFPRNSRRFDIVDHRERTDTDHFFGGTMHPSRYRQLGGDGSGEDRRRNGPIRFRAPYNAADGENLRFNAEDGPLRSFRFCPEGDNEFNVRGNLREREYDRRIKGRPGNAPRRIRSDDEQEENYRHGNQVWNDDGYDDDIRLKRRRF